MSKLLQTLMDGFTVGSLYALIALGYTMVYGVLQFINFAHGDVFMLGAWLSLVCARSAAEATHGFHRPLGMEAVWFAVIAGGAAAILGGAMLVANRYRARRPRLVQAAGAVSAPVIYIGICVGLTVALVFAGSWGCYGIAPWTNWEMAFHPRLPVIGLIVLLAIGLGCAVIQFVRKRTVRRKWSLLPRAIAIASAVALLALLCGAAFLACREIADWTRWTLPVRPARLAIGLIVLSVAAFCCGFIGFTIERVAYRPLRNAPRLNVLITAIGVSLLLENLGQLQTLFGTEPQRMPTLFTDSVLLSGMGVQLRLVDAVIILLAFSFMAGLQWLIHRTRVGLAMRATAYDTATASLMGVPVDRVISFTFIVGSVLAAAAGLLYASKYPGLKQSADTSWTLLGLKAFVAAVVGGIGNIRGAMLGGLLIGLIEFFGAAYLSPQMRDVYVFGLLILVLLVRPTGIMGRQVVEKV